MKDIAETLIKPFRPLKTAYKNLPIFLIWFLFTLLLGQLGIICNIIIRYINGSYSFYQTIYLDSINGSFYTYSIALIAAALGPLFIDLISNLNSEFKIIKVFTIIISMLTLVFASVFYTSTQSKNTILDIEGLVLGIDGWQLGFLVFSVFISIYAYSVLRLDLNSRDFDDMKDKNYAENDDKEVVKLSNKSSLITDDLKGNKL